MKPEPVSLKTLKVNDANYKNVVKYIEQNKDKTIEDILGMVGARPRLLRRSRKVSLLKSTRNEFQIDYATTKNTMGSLDRGLSNSDIGAVEEPKRLQEKGA